MAPWKRRSLLDSIIFSFSTEAKNRFRSILHIDRFEIWGARKACFPQFWIEKNTPCKSSLATNLSSKLDLHTAVTEKKPIEVLCTKFNGFEKLQMKTWKKKNFQFFVSFFFKNLYFFSSKNMVVYIGIIHEFLMRIIGSLLPITTFPLGFFWCITLKIILFSAVFFSFPDNNSESLECPRAVSLSSIWYLATPGDKFLGPGLKPVRH